MVLDFVGFHMNLKFIFPVLFFCNFCSFAEASGDERAKVRAAMEARRAANAARIPGVEEPMPGIKMINDAVLTLVEFAESTTGKVAVAAVAALPSYKLAQLFCDWNQVGRVGEYRYLVAAGLVVVGYAAASAKFIWGF